MAALDALKKKIQLATKLVEFRVQLVSEMEICQRLRRNQCIEVIGSFITRRKREVDISDKLLLIASATVSFDDVRFHGFTRAPDLSAFFEQFKFR
jgi:hypothetical protein